MAQCSTPEEAIQRWVDDRLAEAPPLTPGQAGALADLLSAVRKD